MASSAPWTRSWSPQIIASRILEEHGRGYDDALVVVARYEGGRR